MTMKLLLQGVVVVLILCGGCLPNRQGGYDTVFNLFVEHYPPAIQGEDGTSYETALRVISRGSYDPITPHEEKWLRQEEESWVYERHCRDLDLPRSREDYQRLMQHRTERRGTRLKRDYDIVTLTVPGVVTNATYFDVTRYRYVAPHSY